MSKTPLARNSSNQTNLLWLLAYVINVIGVVVLVFYMRTAALRDFDTPEARAQWQSWREAPPNSDTNGPVRRKPPTAEEPPALLLMRDYFVMVMSAALLFSSLLFAAIMVAARGALSSTAKTASQSDR